MNCADVNQKSMVEYLNSLGFQPVKIRNNDYWYLSPLRQEKEPLFKVHKSKNVWYDHGLGKGGKLVDFAMQFYGCNPNEALQKLYIKPEKIIKPVMMKIPNRFIMDNVYFLRTTITLYKQKYNFSLARLVIIVLRTQLN